ncbi:hypothetical protein ACHAQH_007349 [Verticillium albo-atrum]
MSTLLWDLEPRKLRAILWFTGSLVDEAGKIDANATKHLGIYEAIRGNLSDAVALMNHCFSAGFSQTVEGRSLQEDSIRTLQSWILFSQRLSSRGDETIPSLRTLIPPVLSALSSDDLFEVAADLIVDTLSNYSGFLVAAHYEALFSLLEDDSALDRYRRLVEGDFDFESIQFGQLMLSLGDSQVQTLIENTDATLAGPAAKSIQRLCSSSRQILSSEAGAFLDQYSMLSTRQQIDCITSERVLGAIAAVIYAVPDDQERLRYLDVLLAFVRQDVNDKPEGDTELTQNAIEFVTRLTAKSPAILLDPDLSGSAEFLFLFALRVLDGREPLPKAAAADFWVRDEGVSWAYFS